MKLGLTRPWTRSTRAAPVRTVAITESNRIEYDSIVGQTIAHRLFVEYLPFRTTQPGVRPAESLQSLESRFEFSQSSLTGVAAELNVPRRYHRQLLQDLPAAVCTLDDTYRILTWNRAMVEITGISADSVLDYPYQMLPREWAKLFSEFVAAEDNDLIKTEFSAHGKSLTLNLHKQATDTGDVLIVVEDMTEEPTLERQLDAQPATCSDWSTGCGCCPRGWQSITGIACLAQNIPIETRDPELLEISKDILQQTDRISAILMHSLTSRTPRQRKLKHNTKKLELSSI